MIHITLEDVQEVFPFVYAWRWTHHPELGVYRAIAWMELVYEDCDKVRFDKYFTLALVRDKETVLELLRQALELALANDPEKNLRRE